MPTPQKTGKYVSDKDINTTIYALTLSVLCLWYPAALAEAPFEEAGELNVSDVLDDSLRSGQYFTVDDQVRNDGFLNTYAINSEFGDFEAYGTRMLEVRIREIEALGELQALSKTEVFATAAIEAGLSPITAIIDFSTKPISSILGLPGGIARMFNRYARRTERNLQRAGEVLSNSKDANGEPNGSKVNNRATSLTENFFGVGDAERRWHKKLGTNPYTSNETLRAAIKSVSWADGLGRFTLRRANLPGVSGADIVGRVNNLVWTLDAYELQERNKKLLLDLGFDEVLIELFQTSPALAPHLQTTLISVIENLEGVDRVAELLAQALLVEDEPQAYLLIESALMLESVHRKTPLRSMVAAAPVPTAVTEDGNYIATIALDHLAWTEASAALLGSLDVAVDDQQMKSLILRGSATPASVYRLRRNNWQVSTNQGMQTLDLAEQAAR